MVEELPRASLEQPRFRDRAQAKRVQCRGPGQVHGSGAGRTAQHLPEIRVPSEGLRQFSSLVCKSPGHFYCWAWKPGTLKVQTSGYEPWVDYPVKGFWLDDLWSQHKLCHEVYLDYASKVRVGFVNRLRQVEAIKEREKATSLKQKRMQVITQLAPLRKAFKTDVLDALRPWASQYSSNLERYKFLVLRGASRTGKSTLARGLGQALGLGSRPFVQTVQSASSPDLRSYNPELHDYVVFDNVNDVRFVLDYRALFQANTDVHSLGDSRTGIYSYDVWLFRVPLVVTVDLSAKWNQHDPWIKENCNEVFLQGPSWLEDLSPGG